jgi:hypothetical protein
MTSRVELDIDARQPQLAALFADPQNSTEWMDDVDRIEPISGAPGQFGSIYRLVSKRKGWEFVATVVRRALPMEVALLLTGPHVSVDVRDQFVRLTAERTRLISEEVFTFDGLFRKLVGFLASGTIRRAHRRHLEAFKRFAETRAPSMAT